VIGVRLRVLVLLVCGCLLAAGSAGAQGSGEGPSLRRNRVTFSGGLAWSGGYPIGNATAALRGNAIGASAPPFTLFRADSSVDGVAGAEVRVGYSVARLLSIEVGLAYSRPGIATELSADAEGVTVVLEAEQLAHA
jgi:hypothetical protein